MNLVVKMMKKYQPLTNATFVNSVLVCIYLHCIHILLEYILLYLLFNILGIFSFSGAFLFFHKWSDCSETWTGHINLNLKHNFFLLFFEIRNLT